METVASIELHNGHFHLYYNWNLLKVLVIFFISKFDYWKNMFVQYKPWHIIIWIWSSVISMYWWSMIWLHCLLMRNRILILLLMIMRLCWWIIKSILISSSRSILWKEEYKMMKTLMTFLQKKKNDWNTNSAIPLIRCYISICWIAITLYERSIVFRFWRWNWFEWHISILWMMML